MRKKLLTTLVILNGTAAYAQMLPNGTGAVEVGMRQYSVGTTYYDRDGSLKPIGNKFDSSFTSAEMASGALGSDLKRLYDELKKFDSANTGSNSLADQMTLGHLTGNVESQTKAQYLGIAYGISDHWNIFSGVPFVTASVKTDLLYDGDNNASAVKTYMGNLAFKEIQDGLLKASTLSALTVKKQIQDDYGYNDINHWEYSGVGDVVLGARTNLVANTGSAPRYTMQLTSQIELPTGYSDDPDSLTDASIGKGYVSPVISLQQTLDVNFATFGLDTGLGFGMPTETVRRIPINDESLITKDRKAKVKWDPGLDTKAIGSIGTGTSLLKATYRLGMIEHSKDSYRGDLQGNYATLEKESATKDVFQEIALQLSTVDAFISGAFQIPLIMTLTGHESVAGRGSYRMQFVELSVASFFRTNGGSSSR